MEVEKHIKYFMKCLKKVPEPYSVMDTNKLENFKFQFCGIFTSIKNKMFFPLYTFLCLFKDLYVRFLL